jgi:Ca-activated chloride channel homolog
MKTMRLVSRFVLPFLLHAPLLAQGLWLGPDPVAPSPDVTVPPPRRFDVHIVRTKIAAEIVDGVASTTIDQVFRNGGSSDAEGIWFLPLPAHAVADAFTMTVGGREMQGEVLDSKQARGIYEEIVRKRRDPGLLEYATDGLLRARIYPIPANGEVAVTVRLRQVLQPTGGLYEWRWPLRAAALGDAAAGPLGLDVQIRSRSKLGNVVSPHHGVAIERSSTGDARVSLEGAAERFEDLQVFYSLEQREFGLHLLTYRQAEEAGWFTMLVSPPRTLTLDKAPPRRFVQFVVDTSGSMAGDKIVQARRALTTFLQRLRPIDVFQVVTFASGVATFFPQPVTASAENVASALQKVERLEPLGGTNIAGALQQALSAQAPGTGDVVYLPQIVFVTDGEPTIGVTAPAQILDLAKQADWQQMRLFALGVGNDIDVRLIDDLVLQHRGARDFVRNQEKIEVKVDALCEKLAEPALTDVEVVCDGLDAFDVHPNRTRDLFCGEVMQVVGRYRDHGQRTVRVRGKQNGVQREFAFEVEFPALAAQHGFVQTLWARQHVASLLDAIRRHGTKPELVDEVRRLAQRYGIVTPYTSQLIVEEGMRLAGANAVRDGSRPYGGPTDSVPPPGGRGPTTGGRRGGLSGPATGGSMGPSTGGPAGPAAPIPLSDLGRARSGAGAVAESESMGSDDFYLGGTRRKAAAAGSPLTSQVPALIRNAGGRSFLVISDEFVEQGLPTDWQTQAIAIEAFSPAWFTLLAQNPALREILALGEKVAFRDGARIVRVQPAPAPAK